MQKQKTHMKNENYINIQGWMINELKLKGNELVLYAIIYGFSQDGQSEYFGSQRYISVAMGVSLPTTNKLINKLLLKKLIQRTGESHYRVLKKVKQGVKESLTVGVKESLTNNNNTNNNYNNISKDIGNKVSNGRDDINILLEKLKSLVGMLDGTKLEQRRFAKNFLDSKTPEILALSGVQNPNQDQKINATLRIFQLASQDSFHCKWVNSLSYVYKKAGSIVSSHKSNKSVTFIS